MQCDGLVILEEVSVLLSTLYLAQITSIAGTHL